MSATETGSRIPERSPAAPLLAVDGLHASYRSDDQVVIPAVRDVSFELHAGEVLALVGESAAGKSTVAHSILGLLPPSARIEGDITFRGWRLGDLSQDELRQLRGDEIAMIFQDALSSLTPTLTVADQLAELFRAHRDYSDSEARQLAVEALSRLLPDAPRVADLYPFQISGGMAQRVMITMATALEPSVVIADEPTANLDAAMRHETLEVLERLRDERGVAVLLITHDFGVVARIADRVGVMYAGELVETASVGTVFRHPRHPYTFGLLQSLPTIDGGGRLEPMRGQPPDLTELPEHCPFLPRCNKATSYCRIDPAPRLAPVEDVAAAFEGAPQDEWHRVACYNPITIPRIE
jgi:oligopeptide/dipeptide ABC transporter ATP-binding protein